MLSGKAWEFSEVVVLLTKMEAAGIARTAGTFNALILVCLHTNDLSNAFEFFADMKAAGFTPTAHAFGALREACNEAGDLGKALEVAAEMEAAGFSPDATTGIEH